jgi:hypothetical protein
MILLDSGRVVLDSSHYFPSDSEESGVPSERKQKYLNEEEGNIKKEIVSSNICCYDICIQNSNTNKKWLSSIELRSYFP